MNIQNVLAVKGAHVVTIRPEQLVREALVSLITHNIGSLVVVNLHGQPIGLLSERDIIRAAATDEAVFSQPIRACMVRDFIMGTPQDDLASVAHTMTEKRMRHVPVVDGGKLVGIVSIGDVVKAQRDRYQGEVYTLQMQVSNDNV